MSEQYYECKNTECKDCIWWDNELEMCFMESKKFSNENYEYYEDLNSLNENK